MTEQNKTGQAVSLLIQEELRQRGGDGEGRGWQIPAGRKGSNTAWSSCSRGMEQGRPFSLLPRERWVLFKPSMRTRFLLFPAAPRPETDSTINSRKGNWKECPRKRACGRRAGRQRDWTPPGHSLGLSFLLNSNSPLQAVTSIGETKGPGDRTKLDPLQPSGGLMGLKETHCL